MSRASSSSVGLGYKGAHDNVTVISTITSLPTVRERRTSLIDALLSYCCFHIFVHKIPTSVWQIINSITLTLPWLRSTVLRAKNS
jgi:hypothetical protein